MKDNCANVYSLHIKICTNLLLILNCFFWYFYKWQKWMLSESEQQNTLPLSHGYKRSSHSHVIHIQGTRAHVLFYLWWQPRVTYLIWIITFYSCNVPECLGTCTCLLKHYSKLAPQKITQNQKLYYEYGILGYDFT